MDAIDILRRCNLFRTLNHVSFARLGNLSRRKWISSGEYLYHPGEVADALYILITGRLEVRIRNHFWPTYIGCFQSAGEVSLFTGGQRESSVRAVRDSELVQIDRQALMDFLCQNPATLIDITKQIIDCIRSTSLLQGKFRNAERRRVFAVVPAHPGIDAADTTRGLVAALKTMGATQSIDAAFIDALLGAGAAQTEAEPSSVTHGQVLTHLNDLETRIDAGFLVYQSNRHADAWSQRCMRQADRIILVADARDPPMLTPMIRDALRFVDNTPVDIIMFRTHGEYPSNVWAWRNNLKSHAHYFVRPHVHADYLTVARQLAARAIGLVLGGGGARCFAHLGLLRALERLDIPIDLCGGSSMGAYLAALHALGMDHHQIHEVVRETFVEHNYLNDFLLPRVAFIRGRKFLSHLRSVFGDRLIETLEKPYFCVTSNLTNGETSVHDAGDLAVWVGAGMAVPGIAPPVAWKGELHADGAVINALPTDIMQQMGRGIVLASDVSTEGVVAAPGVIGPEPEALLNSQESRGAKVSMIDILYRTATITGERADRARAELADYYLRMPVEDIGLFDWKRIDQIAEKSYAYAMRELGPRRENLVAGQAGHQNEGAA